ncbi:MAG TPA: 6,7-dimethyl-8-ribityllumazine synthase [Legionellaceae bacterium]|nr:6,7-dimethyl-8-ribityllumazine synthase [Legionellaceae bacterium]
MKMIQANKAQIVDAPVALVVSEFNRDITLALQEGAVERLLKRGIAESNIMVVTVPGAIEIPLIVQRLALLKHYSAIIALGAVIRGETSHYDYVCQQVSQGCQQMALTYDIPVIFGVLTTESDAQAWDRLGGNFGHKGIEAADTALAMIQIGQQLEKQAV